MSECNKKGESQGEKAVETDREAVQAYQSCVFTLEVLRLSGLKMTRVYTSVLCHIKASVKAIF